MNQSLMLPAGVALLLLGLVSRGVAQDAPAGDAAAGQTLFNRQCAMCHSPQAGQNKIGPSLAGVFGRGSAQVSGFNYSPAMRQANKTWDAATLNDYLQHPRETVPNTRMIYAGMRDEKQRADVIAYLATLK